MRKRWENKGRLSYGTSGVNDVDRIWIGGMGAMLILLFLFVAAAGFVPVHIIWIALAYGLLNLAVSAGVYFAVARCVGSALYTLGGMMEDLTGGEVKTAFPVAQDTILSRLQDQLLKLYDILRSYEERERRFRRQLDENIGDLVHQLNTPITNIRLYTGFLGRDDLTAQERERFLGCLEEQAQRLSWLGESFSRISRLETGLIRLKPERQKLQPVILRAVGQIMEKAQARNMEIVLRCDEQTEVTADARWTAEALFNVLDNAVKYGEEGSEIEIETVRLTSYVGVAVRNSGIGAEKEEYHMLFKRFYRGKSAGGVEGSGLGLYIVRKILEDEKGYVKAGRTADGRMEFVLYLYSLEG